jgi:hypothetical protein
VKKTTPLIIAFFLAMSIAIAAQQPTADASKVPAASQAGQSGPADQVLDDGTPVKLTLVNQLSSADARQGQNIQFSVENDLVLDGVIILHRGASVSGVVVEAEKKRRLGRAGTLNFTINSLKLANGQDVPLRAFDNTSGDSHTTGVAALALNMPMVAAPFFLLMYGENTSFPKGTEITAFVNGDIKLDLAKFGGAPLIPAPPAAMLTSLVVDSDPPGANVKIDGSLVGITPATIPVASGSHKLTVKKAGFAEWSDIESVNGATAHVIVVLKKPSAQ